ncbi:C4-dicarboxylate transporter/malic acid transport protein [Microterricola gilva]|uniref:C4-dicarboxylate transporter/malic acid transport protein n=1 Tax=Microterricola gilva TaxID=393267 RepID=A0A4Q8ALY9_9MICO|nr:TDT family transporter [Microterricola gilva]RZU65602.1 C4-dicarboxylate transporter/malic acid transport protein [Microterricola gilva]
MSVTAPAPTHAPSRIAEHPKPAPRRLLRELERPGLMFANITPNWFASVMGTGILATAAASLPLQFSGLHVAATIVWALASTLLIGLLTATVIHWILFRDTARGHHLNPVMAHFYGAPPMAMLTVGAGTLLLGTDIIGIDAALAIDAVLWSVGTLLGLASAITVPFLLFTRHAVDDDSAFGGWLMPVVPPMVSAATGSLLLPHVPDGQFRLTMMLACYAMFGMSLIASLIVITLIWGRLARHKLPAAAMVPTLWIVLGPLGQAITAANLLGANAQFVVAAPWSTALELFGVVIGIPVLGFALMWAALAIAATVRTARRNLPFSLTWWSFTFPVGTCVTGVSALAVSTGAIALLVLAVVLFAGLVIAWVIVAARTFTGSILRGTLFLRPGTSANR